MLSHVFSVYKMNHKLHVLGIIPGTNTVTQVAYGHVMNSDIVSRYVAACNGVILHFKCHFSTETEVLRI